MCGSTPAEREKSLVRGDGYESLTFSDDAVHKAHGETEEDEVVEMVDLDTFTVF